MMIVLALSGLFLAASSEASPVADNPAREAPNDKATGAQQPKPSPQGPGESDTGNSEAIGLQTDTPPPSTYDKQRAQNGDGVDDPTDDRTILDQLVRTVLGLGIVVALIYFLGRMAMRRVSGVRIPGMGGKRIQVLERAQLDPRHALYLVRLDAGKTYLLGSSERGMQLISEVDMAPETEQTGAAQTATSKISRFGEVFKKATGSDVPGRESTDDDAKA